MVPFDLKCPKQASPQRQKADCWLSRVGRAGEKWGVDANGAVLLFTVTKVFSNSVWQGLHNSVNTTKNY